VAAAIAQDLIGRPFVTPSTAAKLYSVSYPAANNAIARLVQAAVLREITGRRDSRVFVSSDVLGILNS
jgi:cell filamentation protein, protein adenylyltransferase